MDHNKAAMLVLR